MTVTLQPFVGPQIKPYLNDLARLRIEIFRDFPYLYDGDLAYELTYLQTYSASPESLFVLVFDGETVVGASTGVPLAHEEAAFQQPFIDQGYDPARIFYFGESLLKPAYRGQGLGVRFFEEREAYARRLGRFDFTVFCAVERPADHPRRPANYLPLDQFWRNRGYRKQPHLATTYRWRDVDETEESAKPMIFWLKAL
ncbi:MAG: GNAT family N-acetyltransferase [Anaerolineae bacterium]|nr:GNAT family N-acetyltransferase [Anaerolineae bacterium]